MRIFVDADGCPVVDITIRCAKKHNLPVMLICDEAHLFEREGADTITVATGSDSVDYDLVNRISKNDIAVTQDYGLAAMCIARQARVLSQNGLVYSEENIDGLLMERHYARKLRMAGGRMKGPPKRTREQDAAFEIALERLISF